MPSAIKYLTINENFPIAGEDNDSQVFRDNFTTIKNSFATAKTEIDDIQASLASFELSNNVNNATVFGTNFQGITYNVNTTYFTGVFFNNEDNTDEDKESPIINEITGNIETQTGEIVTIIVNFSDNIEVVNATIYFKNEIVGYTWRR